MFWCLAQVVGVKAKCICCDVANTICTHVTCCDLCMCMLGDCILWNMCMYIMCLCSANMCALISVLYIRSAGREHAIGIGWPSAATPIQTWDRLVGSLG